MIHILVLILVFSCIYYFLYYGFKNKGASFNKIYFSIILAELVILPQLYFYYVNYISGDWSGLFFALLLGIIAFTNIILIILGLLLYIERKEKTQEKKRDDYAIVKVILTFLCTWAIIWTCYTMPKLFKTKVEKGAEKYTIDYLNNMYGDGNFKVTNIQKAYHFYTFNDVRWKGFQIDLKSSYISKKIVVEIEGTTGDNFAISRCTFLDDYYSEVLGVDSSFFNNLTQQKIKEVEKDFSKEFDLDMDFECNFDVPEKYGHLPTKDDVKDLTKVDTTRHINITINDNLEEKDRLNYLKRLAKFSKTYFNTNEDINIDYTWSTRSGYNSAKGIRAGSIDIKNGSAVVIWYNGDVFNFYI